MKNNRKDLIGRMTYFVLVWTKKEKEEKLCEERKREERKEYTDSVCMCVCVCERERESACACVATNR